MAKPTIQQVVRALQSSWSKDTCFAGDEFSAENPARGQCVVSSLVIQDYFGGDLRRYKTFYDGHEEMHYCNILADGTVIDVTASQYQTPVTLEILPIDLKGHASSRDKRLADDETRKHYELLKANVNQALNTPEPKASDFTPDIHRLLEFQRLLQQFQSVERVTHTPKSHRWENDTEHSYNLAMTGWYLCGHFPHLNRDKVVRYALVHDLVEIHAGDTYIYGDQASLDSKQQREAAALKQLESEWTDFPDMTKSIHAYEQRQDEEAKFVYALDKIMPIMLIYLGDGYTWKQEDVALQRLHEAKRNKVALSDEINTYYRELYELLTNNPQLFPK